MTGTATSQVGYAPPPIAAVRSGSYVSRPTYIDRLADFRMVELVQECGLFKPSIHILWALTVVYLGGDILKHFYGYNYILILSKNPIKWRQRPFVNNAVDWDVKLTVNCLVPGHFFFEVVSR